MRTSNPMLTDKAFEKAAAAARGERVAASSATYSRGESGASLGTAAARFDGEMTIRGTVNKTFILTAILLIAGYIPWNMAVSGNVQYLYPLMIGGIIGGLIVAIVTTFKKEYSAITAPLYAALQGLAVGGISIMFEMRYPGIVLQAVMLTVAVLVALLLAYSSGYIKATENFKLGVVAATGGIMILYLASFILGFFGIQMSFMHDSSPLSIGISIVVVIIAALNLVLDFDFIENGAEMGAPKYMEWYAAFGLMVTLIWLYIEILRLLAKLQDRK
ncbi:Bax inhibitor-1/YccA family protein [Geovibrio ferrireducens]|uniref:Bax inhibitor-1/YccA family protein n=1 Tax=Geovibrio ferrireducens TaxID=46201 RepID=UPI002247A6F1|nr:Bax inhibitor-1/YccA family protein [Geovibrio ferrireducens]